MPLSAAQQWEDILEPAKGWFRDSALDYSADLATAVTTRVRAGAVLSLNASNQFILGVATTRMAIFALQSSDSPDVNIPGVTPAGRFVSQSVSPLGRRMSGLVATGGYEIITMAFDAAKTYAPNDLLTAAAGNTVNSGILANDRAGAGVTAVGVVRQYVDPCCGVVSRGKARNEYGADILTFWPVYLPSVFA